MTEDKNVRLLDVLARLEIGDETLRETLCINPFDRWLAHVPFTFWLIRTLRPRVLLEFCARSRVSHLASCQAIDEQGLQARAYAAEGWVTERRGLEVEEAHYASFSTLVIGDLKQARMLFSEQSIDLLIVRQLKTEQELDLWRPLLSSRAVLLLDNINQTGPALTLWKQLSVAHPHFEFLHAFGLGVVGLGNDCPTHLQTLFGMQGEESSECIRRFFSALGAKEEFRSALEAERLQRRRGLLDHEAHISALQVRSRTRLQETSRHLSTWLDQSLQNYYRWMRAEIHRSRVDAARTVDSMARELARMAADRDLARAQVELLMQSTSWRLTAPLRRVAAMRGSRTSDSNNLPEPDEIIETRIEETQALAAPESLPPALPPAPDLRAKMPELFALREHKASSRIAVVLYVGVPENVQLTFSALDAMPEPFDLFVLLVDECSEHLAPSIRAQFASAHVIEFPESSDDALAFLTIAGTGALFHYEVVCKLVTRLGSEEGAGSVLSARTASLIAAFEDPDLGLVVADEDTIPVAPLWTHLSAWLPQVGLSLGRPPGPGLVSGRTFWIRPWVLRDLVALSFKSDDLEPGAPVSNIIASLLAAVCHSAALKVQTAAETSADAAGATGPGASTVIAFYLPQFHPTPENDRWWGAGFTEWTNVTSAKPLFPGHRQPRLPGEIGFADLRLAETREAQADLARAYGITAFCYYYYWFGPRHLLLHRPLDEVRTTGRPDFPFLICWANEPWSRRWDGAAQEVLVAQEYQTGWEQAFADDAAPVLKDARYFRMRDGRPLLLIYRVMHIPHPIESLMGIRQRLLDLGVGPVHLACGRFALTGDPPVPDDPTDVGCDSYFEFPPHGLQASAIPATDLPQRMTGRVFEYAETVDRALGQLGAATDDRHVHHGVMAGWDNTARRGPAAHIYRGATPAHFRRWLRGVVRHEQARTDPAEKLIFINAWNEWAEGTYLEPDRDYGRGWLEAVRSALGLKRPVGRP